MFGHKVRAYLAAREQRRQRASADAAQRAVDFAAAVRQARADAAAGRAAWQLARAARVAAAAARRAAARPPAITSARIAARRERRALQTDTGFDAVIGALLDAADAAPPDWTQLHRRRCRCRRCVRWWPERLAPRD